MTENVMVLDASNQPLGATYRRRAKTLTRRGRARWVDETTIALVSPSPSYETGVTEDMSDPADTAQHNRPFASTDGLDRLLQTGHSLGTASTRNDSPMGQMDRLLEALQAILPLLAGTEVTVAVSALEGIEDTNPDVKAEMIREIAIKALEVKADALLRIENIFHCVTGQ